MSDDILKDAPRTAAVVSDMAARLANYQEASKAVEAIENALTIARNAKERCRLAKERAASDAARAEAAEAKASIDVPLASAVEAAFAGELPPADPLGELTPIPSTERPPAGDASAATGGGLAEALRRAKEAREQG